MANLTLTYKNYACRRFINSEYPNTTPIIYSTSTYVNPITKATVTVLYGEHLREYSGLRFGNIETNFVFISSRQIEFYIPSIYSSGINPIKMWTGSMESNTYMHSL